MAKQRTKLERLGLTKTTIPRQFYDIMRKRIDSFYRLLISGADVTILDARIRQYGIDCYLQGLMDGSGIGANNPEIINGELGQPKQEEE